MLAGGLIAAIAMAACADNTASRGVTAPDKIGSPRFTLDPAASPAKVRACIDPSSPAGSYTIKGSNLIVGSGGTASFNTPVETTGLSASPVNPAALSGATFAGCVDIATRNTGNQQGDAISSVDVQVTDAPLGASYTSTDCSTYSDSGAGSPASCTGIATSVPFNLFHGSVIVFKFTATEEPPPLPDTATAVFVIGDVEAHDIDDIVNFWGAQWWKNNDMSGLVSKGHESFKGYADSADNFCGGTWTSRPGNSSKPPKTIGSSIAIIVTSTVKKAGPNLSGDIVQIIRVTQDGGYGPNPGHRGNGVVTSVVCSDVQ